MTWSRLGPGLELSKNLGTAISVQAKVDFNLNEVSQVRALNVVELDGDGDRLGFVMGLVLSFGRVIDGS